MPTLIDWRDALGWVLVFFLLQAVCDPAPAADFSGAAIHQERTVDRYWTKDEQARLLDVLKKAPADDRLAKRDDAAIRMLLHSGCRVGEFLKVSVGDAVDAVKGKYLFIPKEHRKGGKRDHRVFVTEALNKDLRDLLEVRLEMAPEYCRNTDPLIVTRLGRDMSVRNFELRLKHWTRLAGLPEHSSPHWARHTRGQNIMLRSTARDPRGVVQAALGHESIRSSGVYTATPREDVEAALSEIDARPGRVSLAKLRRGYEGRAGA